MARQVQASSLLPKRAASVRVGEDFFVALLDQELEVIDFVPVGGSGTDSAADLDVDSSGNVTVLGNTDSLDLVVFQNIRTANGMLRKDRVGIEPLALVRLNTP